MHDFLLNRFGKQSLLDIDEAATAQFVPEYWTDENVTIENASKINSKWLQKVIPAGSNAKIAMIDVLYLAV